MPAQQHGPSAACACGQPPFVGLSRSAKNPGRPYANCARWPKSGHCSYFAWLDGWDGLGGCGVPEAAGPPTPERETERREPAAAPPAAPPAAKSASSAAAPASSAAAAAAAIAAAATDSEDVAHERCAAFLLVVPDDAAAPALLLPSSAPRARAAERVRLLLLPASAHPPAYCTQRLAVQETEGCLPRAPASLQSLQQLYVSLRHCPAARTAAAELCWPGGGGMPAGGLFVLDCETTGLSGRDYIHQLAVVNVATGQLLTALLRTCPRSIGAVAAQVCGATNAALHDPHRPTFGQLAPLLHAFLGGGGGVCSSSSSSSSSSGGSRTNRSSSSPSSGGSASAPPPPLIAAHNGGFDARMLIGEWCRRGLPVPRSWRLLDTLPLAKAFVSGCDNHRQSTLRRHYGIALPPGEAEHDAGTDAVVLARLLPHLAQAAPPGGLCAILEGRVRKKGGQPFVRTFGDVQAGMRGATGGKADEGTAAEAPAFTCTVCHARVVA